MRLNDFDYDLPAELIAQEPSQERGGDRLLVVDRSSGRLKDAAFQDLPDLLKAGDVLVANESRVIEARLFGHKESGGRVELLLVRELEAGEWEVMARSAGRLRIGAALEFPGGVHGTVTGRLGGRLTVSFEGTADFRRWMSEFGRLPVPPYIKQYPADPSRYHTVYSRTEGSIAAPTAGLHFTPELLDRIRASGVDVRLVTLHVGPATFKPLREESLESIRLEAELGTVGGAAAQAVRRAKAEGRRVIAVGTTTTRLLEGVALKTGGEVREWTGPIDLFIRPPFTFQVVDALLTNFHLPRSTLLMLVSAFTAHDLTMRAYRHAIVQRYRFYSFGDAMLIV